MKLKAFFEVHMHHPLKRLSNL